MRTKAVAGIAVAVLCALLATGCAGGFLMPGEPRVDEAAENAFSRTVVVAMDGDYEPYSFSDDQGRPSGFDVELVNTLANRVGFNVDVKLMTWSECIDAVRSGEADLVTGMDYKPLDYPDLLFSRAVQNDPFVCFGREGFDEVTDLSGKRLATIASSGAVDGVLAPYKLLDGTSTFGTYTEAIQAVADGRCDYAVVRYSVGRRILAKLVLDDVRAVGPSLLDDTLCIGASADEGQLVDRIDAALADLEREGSLTALKEKWLGGYVRFIRFEDVLAEYGGIALVLLLTAAAAVCAVLLSFYRKRLAAVRCENASALRLQQYQKLFIDVAHGLYESIYEYDVTRNRAGSSDTERYFESLGLAADTPFDKALRIVADRQVKPEFVRGYLDTFLPENVERAFEQGVSSLSYDFLSIADEGASYRWLRINARVFRWEVDGSLRMIMFREDIEDEKQREQQLLDRAQRDALTGLLNKAAVEDAVRAILAEDRGSRRMHALLVTDIDDFKVVNDRYGHAFGDRVLVRVADILKGSFRSSDVVGRFGGDEYVVLIRDVPSVEWLRRKLQDLVGRLSVSVVTDGAQAAVGMSVGAACFPAAGRTYDELFDSADRALYQVKNAGKRGFVLNEGDSA